MKRLSLVDFLATAIALGSVLGCILIPMLLISPVRTFLLNLIGLKAIASLLCFSLFSILVVCYSVVYRED